MKHIALALILASSLSVVGCSRAFLGGAAVGAGVAGVGYEVYNKDKLDDLDDDYKDGKIDRAEYERRRDEIRHRSVVY